MDLDGLFRSATRALRGASDFSLDLLEQQFPGLNKQAIKRGWIPVPMSVLQAHAVDAAKRMDSRVTDLRLSGTPDGAFRLEVDTTTARFIKHTLSCRVEVEKFAFNQQEQLVTLRCDGDVAVEGRNLLGNVMRVVVERLLVSALKAKSMDAAGDERAVSMRWPWIDVRLGNIAEVRALLDARLASLSLLDVLAFGPVRIGEETVEVKVKPLGLLRSALDVVVAVSRQP